MNKLSVKTKLTLAIFTFISLILSYFIFKAYPLELSLDLFIFIIFACITETFVIFSPSGVGVTLSFGILLSVVVIFGPSAGVLCSVMCIILSIYKMDGKYKHIFSIEWYKTLGNLNSYVISIGISSLFYVLLNNGLKFVNRSMLYMFIAALIYLSIDIIIISTLISFTTKSSTKDVLKDNFTGIITNFLGIATFSVFIVISYLKIGIEMVAILFFPYMLIRYSFRLVYDMKENYLSTIKALTSALEEKDSYTKGHSDRVEKYVLIMANAMGIPSGNMQQLQYAAILHDIGKIGIDDSILNKPGKLTEEEFNYIKDHPVKGINILKDVKFLSKAIEIIQAHHEYYDGTGYPKGLKGDEIPVESQIITISDIFDAVTTDRPYRKAMTKEEAIDIIKSESGKKLNPIVVDTFMELYEKGRFTT